MSKYKNSSPNQIAESIRLGRKDYHRGIEHALHHGWKLGEKLTTVRDQLSRREFTRWIKTDCGMSMRQTKLLMKIYRAGHDLDGKQVEIKL